MDKTYQFQTFEPEILAWWLHHLPTKKPTKGPYTIIMPPPNITGSLHLGHALSSTFQDILVRYHRMLGYDVLWLPGTDHAGIATQMMVERKLEAQGQSRVSLGREGFLSAVLDWKEEYGTRIIEQIKRLGFSANWDRLCFTLDEPRSHAVTEAFVRLYEKKLIYKAQRLVNWDTRLKTALSDLEVITIMEKGTLWTLRYDFLDGSGHVDVATTRPETLFGDQAIAVHPEDERYQHMIGQKIRLPLTDRIIPIIADVSVIQEKGTGAVKVTPGHDPLDYAIAQRHNLALVTIMYEDGTLNQEVPQEFQGLSCAKARSKVLEALGDRVVGQTSIEHNVPYSERSGACIEPRLTWQWYLDTTRMAKKSMEAVDRQETVFRPEGWKEQFQSWLKNIQPWCLTRQLWWGHRLPVWYGPDGHVIVARSQENADQQALRVFGKKVDLVQDEDVLDTWFSSALWPFSTLGWPQSVSDLTLRYPTDVLITGFDILFFWVARMMMLGIEMTGYVPFKQVYIHPLIRDEKGQKMSKTKKNVVDPLDVIEKYGADALRFALISCPTGKQHMRFGATHVEAAQHFMTKLWNIGRFLSHNGLMNGQDRPKNDSPIVLSWPVHQWISWNLSQTLETIENHLTEHRFFEASKALYDFVWHDYCDIYLEFAKDALLDPTLEKEVRHVLRWSFEMILFMCHPFVPFITEKLWHGMKGRWGLSLESWPVLKAPETQGVHDVAWFKEILSSVRRIKATFFREKDAKMAVSFRELTSSQKALLQQMSSFLIKRQGCSCVLIDQDLEQKSFPFLVQKTKIFVAMGDENREQHLAQLKASLDKHEKQAAMLEEKLKDAHFITKAEASVIDEHQERLVQEKSSLRELTSWIKALSES